MTERQLEGMAREAAIQIGRDMKTNEYVKGEMQFTDLTNTTYFIKTYGSIIRYCIHGISFYSGMIPAGRLITAAVLKN